MARLELAVKRRLPGAGAMVLLVGAATTTLGYGSLHVSAAGGCAVTATPTTASVTIDQPAGTPNCGPFSNNAHVFVSGGGFNTSGSQIVGIEMCLEAAVGDCDSNTICATFTPTGGAWTDQPCTMTGESMPSDPTGIYLQHCPGGTCGGPLVKCVGSSPTDPTDNCQLGASNFGTQSHTPAAAETFYTQTSGPPPTTPEVPLAALIPFVGVSLGGFMFVLRRRRHVNEHP